MFRLSGLALFLFALLTGNARAEIVIDTFSVPQGNDTIVSNFNNGYATVDLTQPTLPPTQVLGGSRFLQVASPVAMGNGARTLMTSNGSTGDPDLDVTIEASGGPYSGVATVAWGQASDLNQSFTSLGPNIGFVLRLEDIDPQTNPFESSSARLTFTDGAGMVQSQSQELVIGGALQPDYTWTNAQFGSIDFNDVSRIQLEFLGTGKNNQSLSLSASRFSAVSVPEPSSFAVGLAAVGGIIWHRRRKRSMDVASA